MTALENLNSGARDIEFAFSLNPLKNITKVFVMMLIN